MKKWNLLIVCIILFSFNTFAESSYNCVSQGFFNSIFSDANFSMTGNLQLSGKVTGTQLCVPDSNHCISAWTDINASGSSSNFSMDYTHIQNFTAGQTPCASGYFVSGIMQNGSINCSAPSAGSANTSFNQSLTDTLYFPIAGKTGNTTTEIRAVQLVNTTAEIRAAQTVNTTAEIRAAQTVNTTAEIRAAQSYWNATDLSPLSVTATGNLTGLFCNANVSFAKLYNLPAACPANSGITQLVPGGTTICTVWDYWLKADSYNRTEIDGNFSKYIRNLSDVNLLNGNFSNISSVVYCNATGICRDLSGWGVVTSTDTSLFIKNNTDFYGIALTANSLDLGENSTGQYILETPYLSTVEFANIQTPYFASGYSTNYLLQTEAFGTTWKARNITVTADVISDPSNQSTTAERLYTRVTGVDIYYFDGMGVINQTFINNNITNWTCSVFAKGIPNTENATIILSIGTNSSWSGNWSRKNFTLTKDWRDFSVTTNISYDHSTIVFNIFTQNETNISLAWAQCDNSPYRRNYYIAQTTAATYSTEVSRNVWRGAVNYISGTLTTGSSIVAGGLISAGTTLAASTSATVGTNLVVGANITLTNGMINISNRFNIVNTGLALMGNSTTNYQINIRNIMNGSNSTSDFIAYANNIDNYTRYINVGIASQNYSNNNFSNRAPNDGYLLMYGGSLGIGTGMSHNITFFTNGTLSTNEKMRILSTGHVGINTTTPTSTLTVSGSISTTSLTLALTTTLPTCGVSFNRTFMANNTGVFLCGADSVWKFIG